MPITWPNWQPPLTVVLWGGRSGAVCVSCLGWAVPQIQGVGRFALTAPQGRAHSRLSLFSPLRRPSLLSGSGEPGHQELSQTHGHHCTCSTAHRGLMNLRGPGRVPVPQCRLLTLTPSCREQAGPPGDGLCPSSSWRKAGGNGPCGALESPGKLGLGPHGET